MVLFLISLGMVFAATLVGLMVVRLNRNEEASWLPANAPALPAGLTLSTVFLVTSSVTYMRALGHLRQDRTRAFARWMVVTFGLALFFLLVQGTCWWVLIGGQLTLRSGMYGWLFYVLTGLHAVHVIGGLIPMGIVVRRSIRGWYDASNRLGVELVAMYWHFLDVVWLILFGALLLAR